MGLKIVRQTNETECGVCALSTLHNFFYKESIDKEQALDQSVISDNGMTLFDFETLGNKLGLACESYEINFAEFISLKIGGYFVLLLSVDGSNNHFVIARKKKKYIEIYDSRYNEPKRITYAELKKTFLNVIILVKKEPNKIFSKVFGNAKTLLMFDLKFVLLNLLLSISILAISVVCASFLNYVIDMAISKSSVNNLITIAFIFVLFYFMNDILYYVSSLYMSKHVKNYFVLFTNKILSSVENKKMDFLNKVNGNWIFKVDECVYNISYFCIVEINRLITNVIFTVVCICVIGIIQYYMLIFVLAYIVIELIFFLFSYRKKHEIFLNIVKSENKNARYYKNLIFSLGNEIWLSKRKALINEIKHNYSQIYKNYSDSILFKNNTNLFKSLLKSFCEICVICLMSYLIIKDNKLSIGQLTFVISSFGLFKNAIADLLNYWLAKIEFDVYWQVYKDLTTVSNLSVNTKITEKQQIKTLAFVKDNITYRLNIKNKINYVPVRVLDLFKNQFNIFINDKDTMLDKQLFDSFIIINQSSSCNPAMLIEMVSNNPILYSQYLTYFKIDLNNQTFDFYQNMIINFLMLLNEKNKIIIVDDLFSFIKKEDQVVIKQILNKVQKQNTLFIVGREENA